MSPLGSSSRPEYARGLEQRLQRLEGELLPLRSRLAEASLTIKQLEYDLHASERSHTTKIDELNQNFASV